MDLLFDIKHDNFDSITDYVLEMKSVIGELAQTGHAMDDEVAAFLLLRNQKREYKWLWQLIERTSTEKNEKGDTVLTFRTVFQELVRVRRSSRRAASPHRLSRRIQNRQELPPAETTEPSRGYGVAPAPAAAQAGTTTTPISSTSRRRRWEGEEAVGPLRKGQPPNQGLLDPEKDEER